VVCSVVGGRGMEMMGRVVRVWKSGRRDEGKVVVMSMGWDARAGLLCRGTKTTSMRMR